MKTRGFIVGRGALGERGVVDGPITISVFVKAFVVNDITTGNCIIILPPALIALLGIIVRVYS